MIQPEQGHHVFGVGAFRKSGEATQIAEQSGDLAAMAFQLLFRSGRNDQIGDLRRQEATQPAHALDLADLVGHTLFELLIQLDDFFRPLLQLAEQLRVLDRDNGLRGEVLHQRDLLVCERSNFLAIDGQRSEQHFVLAKCNNKGGPRAAQVYHRSAKRITKPIRILVHLIAVNELLALNKSPMCVS
jgi:hypothetical protein